MDELQSITDEQIKLECLKIAGNLSTSAEEAMSVANDFFLFVRHDVLKREGFGATSEYLALTQKGEKYLNDKYKQSKTGNN